MADQEEKAQLASILFTLRIIAVLLGIISVLIVAWLADGPSVYVYPDQGAVWKTRPVAPTQD